MLATAKRIVVTARRREDQGGLDFSPTGRSSIPTGSTKRSSTAPVGRGVIRPRSSMPLGGASLGFVELSLATQATFDRWITNPRVRTGDSSSRRSPRRRIRPGPSLMAAETAGRSRKSLTAPPVPTTSSITPNQTNWKLARKARKAAPPATMKARSRLCMRNARHRLDSSQNTNVTIWTHRPGRRERRFDSRSSRHPPQH